MQRPEGKTQRRRVYSFFLGVSSPFWFFFKKRTLLILEWLQEKAYKYRFNFYCIMKATLYRQAKDVERMDEKIRDLNSSNQIDVAELQRNLFHRYESNPVLYDAMKSIY